MKKYLIIAMLAMSAFFGTGIASAGDAKYYVDGKEVSYEQFVAACKADWISPY
ncbi:MAG: hypothetical protein K6U74_21265 [Firmicutes bacterium]|nr:hypothetical protein [Bacillota bacterium]